MSESNAATPSEHDRYYAESFTSVNYEGLTGLATRLSHKFLERDFPHTAFFPTVLELGAAHGEHLRHVRHGFDRWILSDLVDQGIDMAALRGSMLAGVGSRTVEFEVQDATRMQLEDASVDRVVHTCLLHHVKDTAKVFAEVRRVLRPGGVYSAYIPCDPGLTYRAVQRVTAGRAIRRELRRGHYSITPAQLRALEHPNHFAAIWAHFQTAFQDDEVRAWHFPVPAALWNINFFTIANVHRS
jgi:phosphatidylethanolamine/phosphatidyl-N-methylethanolamine N-methyltransferase